jgi:hypothetical protein
VFVSVQRSVLRGLLRVCGVVGVGIGRGAGVRRLRQVASVLTLGVLTSLTPLVGAAQAAPPTLVPNGTIRSTAGAGGVAVDQSNGDVFVAGLFTFHDNGTGHLEVGLGHIEGFDAAGTVLSPPGPFAAESFHWGVAVNPTNGHLYAVNPFGVIEVYDPNTGAPLPSFSVPPFWTESELEGIFGENGVQIATDSAGDVYVPNVPGNEVLKYSETGELLQTFTGSGAHALKRPTGVAVDSSGDVWVADNGGNRIEELSPAGAFMGEFESEGVRELALDAQGDVLAIVDNEADDCGSLTPPCQHLVEYSSSGAQLADFGAGEFGFASGPGESQVAFHMVSVAVDGASGRVYVADGSKELVWVFQPPVAPVLGQESAVEVGTSQARLGAVVNPGGAQTTYRFEYDTRGYTEGEGPHGTSVPFPKEGSAGEGFSARTVWASANGLSPGTTYHYRASVTSALGTVVGPDQTFTTETAAQAACPNEEFRGGFSARLPDCRAYELVTVPTKDTAEPDTHQNPGEWPEGGSLGNYAAENGGRFTFESDEVLPGSQSAGLQFISVRGATGWASEDALPLQPYTGDRCNYFSRGKLEGVLYTNTYLLRSSANLSKSVIVDHSGGEGEEQCLGETAEVVPGEPLIVENLLLRNNENGSYQLINAIPPGVTPTPARLLANSADLGVVVFSERAKLTPDALNNTLNLYEWREGAVHLLTLTLPSGAPVTGSVVSISRDGSEIFFTADGNLYVQPRGARTVQLDEARGGSGPGGGGTLVTINTEGPQTLPAISADGSQALFTDDAAAGLTSDTVAGSGNNLYRYDLSTGQLSDLTPVGQANAGLEGMSEDGSYMWFRSDGVLSGSQANQFGETAQSGEENLYLDHDGAITFVIHAEMMSFRGGEEPRAVSSSNGAFLAFASGASLTGYDNAGQDEIYLYSAASNRFECASCNPSGEAPTARGAKVAQHVRHTVSDAGQVFFQTPEALLPRDTNGALDVYEFDYYNGLQLLSTGTSADESWLLEASPSGDDVFILTTQSLVPRDSVGGELARKIYDARVQGGFPEAALPPACTTADACRSASAPQPSIYGAPSSQTFSGAGNLVPPTPTVKTTVKSKKCQKGFARKKGKCVKTKKNKKAKKTNRKGRR